MRSSQRTGALAWGVVVVALVAGLLVGCGGDDDERAAEPPSFAYSGEKGPSHWGSLDPAYRACSEGERQSPIDLDDAKPSALPGIRFSYEPAALDAENNGHSVEVEYPPGSSVEIGGAEYELEQFHYHAPSEHRMSGRALPLELHFVNKHEDGGVAVLSVLVEDGDRNPAFSNLVQALPREEGQTLPVQGEVNALDLLPPGPASAPRWSYEGSLTTPPCTEGVRWEVLKRPIELSADQIARYRAIYDHNNRPLQPSNARELLVSR